MKSLLCSSSFDKDEELIEHCITYHKIKKNKTKKKKKKQKKKKQTEAFYRSFFNQTRTVQYFVNV